MINVTENFITFCDDMEVAMEEHGDTKKYKNMLSPLIWSYAEVHVSSGRSE